MTLYKYSGAMYNGKVIYKNIIEYVQASSKPQAIQFLKIRLKKTYPNVAYIELKESSLNEITKENKDTK